MNISLIQNKKRIRNFLSTNLTRLVLILVVSRCYYPMCGWQMRLFQRAALVLFLYFSKQITFDNYVHLFEKTKFLKWLRNSAIVTLFGSLLALWKPLPWRIAFSRFIQRQEKRIGVLDLTAVCLPRLRSWHYIRLQCSFNCRIHFGD
jgi:ABC-type maltose transport system permease subunit